MSEPAENTMEWTAALDPVLSVVCPPQPPFDAAGLVNEVGENEDGYSVSIFSNNNESHVNMCLADFTTTMTSNAVDPETASETSSGISELTSSGLSLGGERGCSGRSSITSDFGEELPIVSMPPAASAVPLVLAVIPVSMLSAVPVSPAYTTVPMPYVANAVHMPSGATAVPVPTAANQSTSIQSETDEGKLSEIFLRDLSTKIGFEYAALGTYLGFEKPEMDGFTVRSPEVLSDRIFGMLWTWKTKTDQPKVEDLAGALRQCGRVDLAQKLTEPHMVPNQAYKRLLVEFQDQVTTEDDRAKVTYLIQQDQITGQGVPLYDQPQQPLTTFQIVQCLQKYNYLGQNNVWYLQYIAFVLKKKDLYKIILAYASSRLKKHKTLHLHEAQFDKMNNHTIVRFSLVGDFKHFGNIEMEQFKQMLADNFDEEIRYINVVGAKDGCIMLFVQLRERCAEKARKAAKEKTGWLPEMGVMKVEMFGNEPEVIPVQKLELESKAELTKDSQLLMALLEDDKKQAKQLLANGANPNGKPVGGMTFLHWAIALDKEEFVRLLLDYKADRNKVDEYGQTPEEQAKFLKQCLQTLTFHIDIDLQEIIKKHFPPNTSLPLAQTVQKPYDQERRQFVCEPCSRIWTAHVSAEKPSSRCSKCKHIKQALPVKNNCKRTKCKCPMCGNIFSGWEYNGIRPRCFACGILAVPYSSRHGSTRRRSSSLSLQRFAMANCVKKNQQVHLSP